MVAQSKELIEAEVLELIDTQVTFLRGFEILLTLYQKDVYWQIRRMVDIHEDAADLSQEVWLIVYKKLSSFNRTSTLYTWIYRIAINTSLNFLKKRKNRHKKVEALPLLADTMNETLPTEETMWRMLQEAVQLLPERQQLVFNLRYFEEKKYQEISDLLGTSEGALKASYHIAVKKIEAYVKDKL